MLKFFQIATPDDDPDNWRSKKEEAEQEAEMAIVRPIITKIDDHVKAYEDIPKYVYGTTMESMEIDANQMLQQAEEDSDVEDFYFDDVAAKELREFVKQWNAKYAKSYYSWNDKVVVMLPTEYQKERVND